MYTCSAFALKCVLLLSYSTRQRCRVYAIQVADSVLVKPEGQEAELLTRFAQADWEQISYEIQDEEEEEEEEAADDSEMDVSDDEPNGRSNGRSKCARRSRCYVYHERSCNVVGGTAVWWQHKAQRHLVCIHQCLHTWTFNFLATLNL